MFIGWLFLAMFARSAPSIDTCDRKPSIAGLNDHQTQAICEALKNFPDDKLGPYHPGTDVQGDPHALEMAANLFLPPRLSEKPYSVQILDQKLGDCSHPIVLMGEVHFKRLQGSQAGVKVIEQFRFRGFEDATKTLTKIKNSKGLEESLFGSDMLQRLESTGLVFGSTIFESRKKGIVVGEVEEVDKASFTKSYRGLAAFLADKGHVDPNLSLQTITKDCPNPDATLDNQNILSDPGAFLEKFGSILNVDAQSQYNFHLETGDLDRNDYDCTDANSASCQEFVVPARNRLMAKNIKRIVPQLPCGQPFLVVVGEHHIDGMAQLLSEGSDYSKRDETKLRPTARRGFGFW